jgi:predicted Zn-ribbon and HTH transcriptional regulator
MITSAEIVNAWNHYDSENPDRSWEWMSARVIDHFDHQIDVADIAYALMPRNESLPAGSPMVFSCTGCGQPIWVPECYVAKPSRCPSCGGEWSQGPLPWLVPGETNG